MTITSVQFDLQSDNQPSTLVHYDDGTSRRFPTLTDAYKEHRDYNWGSVLGGFPEGARQTLYVATPDTTCHVCDTSTYTWRCQCGYHVRPSVATPANLKHLNWQAPMGR